MVLALQFSNTFDLTAVGTLTLAFATGISLVFGWRSLAQTQRQIELSQSYLEQTQREIEVSRHEVEEAHRPVVVPVLVTREPRSRSVTSSGRVPAPAYRPEADDGVLRFPVQNIGSGPALNVEASVTRLDSEGNPWTDPIEPQAPGTVAGIGKDQTIPIEIRAHGWEQRWSFELTVTYEDVARKGWTTVARWNAQDGRYDSDVSIVETDVSRG
jgi:hypothetical protein